MNPKYLSSIPVVVNAPLDDSSSGGITRRSFLKRSGGATVAAMVAWSLTEEQLRAEVINDSISLSGTKDAWKIKVDAINHTEDSEGSEKTWSYDHDNNPNTPAQSWKVKKVLWVYVTAPQTDFADSAKSDVSIVVAEWAIIERNPSTSPGIFTIMTETEFEAYRDGNRDVHSSSAFSEKTINTDTGNIVSTTTSDEYDDTVSGIFMSHEWEGDKLKITFGGTGVPNNNESVEAVFHIKSHSIQQ